METRIVSSIGHRRYCAIAHILLVLLLTGCSDDSGSKSKPAQQAGAAAPAANSQAEVSLPVQGVLPLPAPATPALQGSAATKVVQTGEPEESESAEQIAQTSAEPTQHIVKGVVTQWRPMILFIKPGDSVVFRQMIGHDTEAMEGLYPSAAEGWRSKLGQEGYSITLTEPGAYIYKCNPHVSTGMVGAIVVGENPPANLAELEASPQNKGMIGRAIRKLKQALEAAES